jgi:hypothetical protein
MDHTESEVFTTCKNNQNCQLVVCGYGDKPAQALHTSVHGVCLFCWNWNLFHLVLFVTDHDFLYEYNSSASTINRRTNHEYQTEVTRTLSRLTKSYDLHVRHFHLDSIDSRVHRCVSILLDSCNYSSLHPNKKQRLDTQSE